MSSPPPASDVTIRQLKAFSVPINTAASAVLSDGTKYYGDIRPHDGAPHGRGYAYLADGSRYGGDWRDGRFHGKGAMVTDSYEYEGSWEYGRMHGPGTMLYKDSIFSSVMHGITSITPFEAKHRPLEYRGDFHHDHHRHGRGVMVYRSGDCYDGEWNCNMRDGYGTMKFENGEKYVGCWCRDERSGVGTMTYNDGSLFTGNMVADERKGEGVLKFPNGDEYRGNFEDDNMDGFGVMDYRNGDRYTGMWKDGIRHGKGEFLLKKSGATITGTFVRGLIQGKGCVCVLPGRSVFKGEYSKGERIRGTCWMNDGTCYDGEWVGDSMTGKGLMWYANGDFYYGQFQRSKRHGKGCLNILADGTEYAGEFSEDRWCGIGMRQDRDGNISAGTFGVALDDVSGSKSDNKKASAANASNSVKLLPATKGMPKIAVTPTQPTSSSTAQNLAASDRSSTPPPVNNASPATGTPVTIEEPSAAEVFPLLHGYQGEWDGTGFAGIGHLYLESGDHFFGLFEKGYRNGYGQMTRVVDKSGMLENRKIPVSTTGTWERDSLTGYATVRFHRGTLYQGYWKDGLRHGHGQFKSADGTIYNGGWQNDVQFGEGCLFVVNRKEPIYAYPPEPKTKEQPAAGIFGSVMTLFSSSAKEAKPEPILLGYEDLCAVHGKWHMDTENKKDFGKLYGTVTLFFSDAYEKVYQGKWVGNRQRIDFPHHSKGLPSDQADEPIAPPTTTAPTDANIEVVGASSTSSNPVASPPLINTAALPTSSSPIAVSVCSFCNSQFGFFKKESACVGCARVSCPSCLQDSQPPFLSRTKSLAHPTKTHAIVTSVPLCKDCINCIKKGVVYATQWFTFRRRTPSAIIASSQATTPSAATASASPDSFAMNSAATPIHSQQLESLAADPAQTSVLSPAEDTSPARVMEYQVYKGFFIEGNIPNGHGTLWRGEECCYQGEFKEGQRSGQGTVVWSNGEEYCGGWANNKPHGLGAYRCNDGTVVEAIWSEGKLQKLRYQGEVSPGGFERHGTGIAIYDDGTRYNGEWDYNARHGTGLVQYSNGTMYTGQFAHDNQHGIGKIVTSDSVFLGEFREGSKHGEGVLVIGRKTLKGTWSDDVLSGWVRIWNDESSEIIDTLYRDDEERTDVFIKNIPQEDEAVLQCPGCKSSFGFFLRRHHCRLCGGVFCDSCSKARAVIPAYFDVGDQPQRVCERCKTSLKAGSTLAVKRYRDGGVYVGQWSQGHWAGRGIYRSPNGHIASILSKPPGGATGQSFSPSSPSVIVANPGPNLHEDLNIVEDLRQQLASQPAISQVELDGFKVWWDKIVNGVNAPYTYDWTPFSEIPIPPISLPFEVNVFTGYASNIRPRERASVEARRQRFVPAALPPLPPAPWHLRPVRPRKIVEPTEEDVLTAIRAERVKGYLAQTQGTSASDGPAEVLPMLSIKTLGDLRKFDEDLKVAQSEREEVPVPYAALTDESTATTEETVLSNMARVRINLATPPKPSQDGEVTEWKVWDPKPVPTYKGVASAPGGELLAPVGDINDFHVEGLDSGPLLFTDLPQKFTINWNVRGPPIVTQSEREKCNEGPDPLPPMASTSFHTDPDASTPSKRTTPQVTPTTPESLHPHPLRLPSSTPPKSFEFNHDVEEDEGPLIIKPLGVQDDKQHPQETTQQENLGTVLEAPQRLSNEEANRSRDSPEHMADPLASQEDFNKVSEPSNPLPVGQEGMNSSDELVVPAANLESLINTTRVPEASVEDTTVNGHTETKLDDIDDIDPEKSTSDADSTSGSQPRNESVEGDVEQAEVHEDLHSEGHS